MLIKAFSHLQTQQSQCRFIMEKANLDVKVKVVGFKREFTDEEVAKMKEDVKNETNKGN